MKHLKIYSILFLIGAVSYGLIELIWRGHTHPTMIFAGGTAFLSISFIGNKFQNLHILYQCILCSIIITLIEVTIGFVFNIYLGIFVWDYSKIPINFYGQICLLYTVLWGFLSFFGLKFSKILKYKILSRIM